MNLEEADLSRLIPRSMMDDPSCSAICKALNPFFRDLAKNANLVTAVLSIEKLNSEQCDKLANDLAVPWYLSSFTLQKKKAAFA